MEHDASTFTAGCNYDVAAVTNGWGIKQVSSATIDPVASLKQFFGESKYYYGVSI